MTCVLTFRMLRNQPGTVEKNSSTIGPPAGIDMCMIHLELKTHLLFRIYPISSQMPQNLN